MKIRVEFDELDYLTKKTEENKSNLEKEINNMLNSLERMKLVWEGEEADIYYAKAHEYITKMKVLCGFMDTTSEFIKIGNNQYQNQDKEFSHDLMKESEENEFNSN